MKKLIVVCLLILMAAPVFAAGRTGSQTDKGNFVVTLPLFKAGIGMGDLYKSGKIFAFGAYSYEPVVEYFFMDNLAIGGKFGYESNKTDGGKTTTFTMGPVADYFFSIKLGPTLPYAGAGLFYTSTGGDSKLKKYEFELHGGVVYMLGKYLSAYGQAQFNYDQAKNGESVSGQKIVFSGGVKAFF
jgi:hypothetical protein